MHIHNGDLLAERFPGKRGADVPAESVPNLNFRIVLEQSVDAHLIVNVTGTVVYANKLARSWFDAGDEPFVGSYFGYPVQTCNATELEVLVRGCRSPRTAEMRVAEIEWEGEAVYLCSLRDITERLATEQENEKLTQRLRDMLSDLLSIQVELAEAKELVESTDRAKCDFMAMVEHEIGTPLNIIFSMCRKLHEAACDQSRQQYIRTIRASGNALSTLIDDILKHFTQNGYVPVLEEVAFSLPELLHEIIDLFHGMSGEKPIQLDLQMDPDLPEIVLADPQRLRQVLSNLMNNAVQYTQQGSIMLKACLVDKEITMPGEDLVLEFSVIDTGVGLSLEQQNDLFESVPSKEGWSWTPGKSGLGLTICHRLVCMMGGEIGVVSHPGKGSAFSFRIAVKVEEANAA